MGAIPHEAARQLAKVGRTAGHSLISKAPRLPFTPGVSDPGSRSHRLAPLLPSLLLALVLSCDPNAVRAQTAPAALVLKIVPQHLVLSGLWLEAERGIGQRPGQAVALTVQGYAGPPGHPDRALPPDQALRRALLRETVRGAGVQLQHRLYRAGRAAAAAPARPTGWYFGYGPTVQHYALGRDTLGWQQVVPPDGGPAYADYRTRRLSETIWRYGAAAQLGGQFALAPGGRLLLDVYAGLGWRTSRSREAGAPVPGRYRSGPSDYGHRGWYFPAGFKVGLAL